MEPRPGIENLKPPLSPEEAREQGSLGGKASVEARRKKKLLSEIYGDFLAAKVVADEEVKEMTGDQFVSAVMEKVLVKGGAPAVSLIKEIREATEGNKVKISGDEGFTLHIDQDMKGV
jgi:hypothetical protein